MRGALLGALLGAVALALALGFVFLSTGEPDIGYPKLVLGLVMLCLGATAPGGALWAGLQYHRSMVEPEAAPPIMEDLSEYNVYEDDGWDADIEDEGSWLPPSEPNLAETIAKCAQTQAIWHYEHGREPTRGAFSEAGVSQPEWNSGRHILRIMGLVTGTGRKVQWQVEHISAVTAALNRIVPDRDCIWVPHVGNGRGLSKVLVSETLENNRHTRFTPTYTAPLRDSS